MGLGFVALFCFSVSVVGFVSVVVVVVLCRLLIAVCFAFSVVVDVWGCVGASTGVFRRVLGRLWRSNLSVRLLRLVFVEYTGHIGTGVRSAVLLWCLCGACRYRRRRRCRRRLRQCSVGRIAGSLSASCNKMWWWWWW